MEYYSAMKKDGIMPSAVTWMQLHIIILSEMSEKKDKTMWYHLWVKSKQWHKWTYIWTETESLTEQTGGCQGKDGLGGWG